MDKVKPYVIGVDLGGTNTVLLVARSLQRTVSRRSSTRPLKPSSRLAWLA